MPEPSPPPRISITLAAPLRALVSAAGGLPGLVQAAGPADAPLISVRADDAPCRFPGSLVAEALGYVMGTHQVFPDEAAVRATLPDLGPMQATELVSLVCQEALSAQRADGENAPAAESIAIHVSPGYLRDLTTQVEERDAAYDDADRLFPWVREALFVELGLVLPPFRLVPDPALRERGFAVEVNGVRSLPRIGLPAGVILVNALPSRLAPLGVKAAPTVNPASGQMAALAPGNVREALEGGGYPTWDGPSYIALCLAQTLRSRAHDLMSPATAAAMTGRLGQAFPALQEAADTYVPPEVLAPVLRDLLADNISVRNLRRILDLLLYYETAGDAAGDRITFVRRGLTDAIADKFARQTGTLVAYILAPEADAAIAAINDAGQPAGTEELADRLLAGVGAELASLQPTASVPVLLTADALRRPLRSLLRTQYPRVGVVGYGDLPPGFNVQPVARISLAAAG